MPTKPRFWIFLLVILLQLGAAIYMPVRAKIIRATGRQISLQLAPVDPYDLMTGYSVNLWFKASRLDSYPPLPQAPELGETLFATLRRGSGEVWNPVALTTEFPRSVKPGDVVLKGTYDRQGWSDGVWFGTEKMYIPAEQRDEIGSAIQEFENRSWRGNIQQPQRDLPPDYARADIIVDSHGNGSLVGLHIAGHDYR